MSVRKSVSTVSPIAGHQLLNSQEVCELLRVCPKTLFNWRKDRRIEFIQRGRHFLYRREYIESFLVARTVVAA